MGATGRQQQAAARHGVIIMQQAVARDLEEVGHVLVPGCGSASNGAHGDGTRARAHTDTLCETLICDIQVWGTPKLALAPDNGVCIIVTGLAGARAYGRVRCHELQQPKGRPTSAPATTHIPKASSNWNPHGVLGTTKSIDGFASPAVHAAIWKARHLLARLGSREQITIFIPVLIKRCLLLSNISVACKCNAKS